LLDLNWDGTLQQGARVYGAAGYNTAFASLLVVNLAALIGTLLLRETWCRQVGTEAQSPEARPGN
jgi:hypothetical protein